MPNPKKVADAYNDLGHEGSHKLSIADAICLKEVLQSTLEHHLVFSTEIPLENIPLLSGYHRTVKAMGQKHSSDI